MFFRFPPDASGIPSGSSSSSASRWANMRVWCAFPGAFSKSCFQRPRRPNDASKPTTFTAPGSNSSQRGRSDGGS